MARRKARPVPEPDDLFARANILAFSPDEASIPAAEKVLKKGGFGKVEASADGKGWWVVCRGLTDTYQVSLRVGDGHFDCDCTCPSPKYPCKHALALLLYLHDHPEERVEPETPGNAATDFEALVRAVFQNPEDDTARLVFADYLDENDQPDRAALIRLQVEKAGLPAKSARARELAAREKPLLQRVRKAAVQPLPEGMRAEFRRGFIHLTANLYSFRDVGALPERFTRLFRDGWVETFQAGEYTYDPLTEDHALLLGQVAELDFSRVMMVTEDFLVSVVTHAARMREFGRLCRVKVAKRDRKSFDELVAAQAGGEVNTRVTQLGHTRGFRRLTRQSFELLRRAGRFRSAREIVLDGPLGDWEAEQLAATDLGEVDALHLSRWQIGPDGLAALANAAGLPGLRTLTVVGSRLEPDHLAALARGPVSTRLRRLGLNGASLTDAGLRQLCEGLPFPNLQHLNLESNALTPAGVAAVLRSPNFPALNRVVVGGNRIEPAELLPVILGPSARPARTIVTEGLTVSAAGEKDGVHLGITAADGLDPELFRRVDPAAAKRVAGLQVSRTRPDGKALAAVAKAFDPAVLRAIEFRDVPLRNDGAAELVAAFRGYAPHTLRLVNSRIQASGVAALVDSPLVESLKVLDLGGNTIGKAGAAALTRSSRLGNLTRLELTGARLSPADQQSLRAKFGKKLVL